MRVGDAKEAARRWVADEAAGMSGFAGAYFAGSINWLGDDEALPQSSDVDVFVVLDGAGTPERAGKFVYRDVLLDVSYVRGEQLRSPRRILADYHKAGSFRTPNVILDPTGELAKLQTAVAKDYAKREWVRARCEHARNHSLRYVRSLKESDHFHDQVISWLFAAGVTTHVLLVAGLRNPTVRRRYVAVRELLAEHGRLDVYESLLELLGCAGMSSERVARHVDALADAFDAAAGAIATPVVFASDISAAARPVAIDGSRELIERGQHREAVFWVAVTYSRCQKVLVQDAPELREQFAPDYRELLGDLGIESYGDLARRTAQVESSLPRVWEVAAAIMAANAEIED